MPDLLFPCFTCAEACSAEADVSSLFANRYIVQLQIGIGPVINLYPRCAVGLETAGAVQCIRLHHNVTAADGNIRDFHVADDKSPGNKYF